MIELPQANWSLIEGASTVRTAVSLSYLAKPQTVMSASCIRDLRERLAQIEPFASPPEHPWVQIGQCAKQAKNIATDYFDRSSDDEVTAIVSCYEAGILAGFDCTTCASDDAEAGRRPDQFEDIVAVGWRHGAQIRRWWSSYHSAVEALFGRRRS